MKDLVNMAKVSKFMEKRKTNNMNHDLSCFYEKHNNSNHQIPSK